MITSQRRLFHLQVEKQTGVSVRDLEAVEQLLLMEDKPTQMSAILRRSHLPPAHEIMRRLFAQEGVSLSKFRGSSKYKFDSKTVNGSVYVSCRLSLSKARFLFKLMPVMRVQIICRVVSHLPAGGECMFKQDILVMPTRGCKIRKREGKFALRGQAQPSQMIPPPIMSQHPVSGISLLGAGNGP